MWGNTHYIGRLTRVQVIAAYRQDFLQNSKLQVNLHLVRGKRIGCHCKPLGCHGDVIAFYADNPEELTRDIERLARGEALPPLPRNTV